MMSEEYDNFWDPYCPCKVTRKNVVMTFLAIGCFALVVWTVFETSKMDEVVEKEMVMQIKVLDTKGLEEIDIV